MLRRCRQEPSKKGEIEQWLNQCDNQKFYGSSSWLAEYCRRLIREGRVSSWCGARFFRPNCFDLMLDDDPFVRFAVAPDAILKLDAERRQEFRNSIEARGHARSPRMDGEANGLS